jgi:hypothetical protein
MASEGGTHRLRTAHGLSALAIGLFLLVHMGNHLVGLSGQAAHQEYMAIARSFYRHPVFETLLLGLLAWQVASGLYMVIKGWRGRAGVAWLQAISGLYLAFFLLNHVGAVLGGRYVFGLDTDFRFAAAGFFVPPWQYFFAPYYFLGVLSLFTHLGCALYWLTGGRAGRYALVSALCIGAAFALAVVLSLSGTLFEVTIPQEYRTTYGA